MKISGVLSIVLILLWGCQGQVKSKQEGRAKQEIVQFRNLHGEPVHLASFRGSRILVNYWATWCAPCRMEFPSLASAQEILKDENYVFLFPSPDDVQKIIEFRQKENYPFQFLTMEGSMEEMKVKGLPSTVIYDTEGNEHYRLVGAHKWDNDEVIRMLKQVP